MSTPSSSDRPSGEPGRSDLGRSDLGRSEPDRTETDQTEPGQPMPPLKLQVEGRIATISFGQPPLNILDLELLAALDRTLDDLRQQPQLRLLVLRGRGERAFSAGASIQDHRADRVAEMLARFHSVVRKLVAFEIPSLAAVRGHCLGGGLELALACDLLAATDDSTFGLPEIRLGCFPPVAAALLPRTIGKQRTLDFLLTGRALTYDEARQAGWISRMLATQAFDRSVGQLADELTQHSAAAVKLIKRAVSFASTTDFTNSLAEAERLYLEELVDTHDMNEGIQAYLEKREPRWLHR